MSDLQTNVICPTCDEPTTQEEIDKWEMCHDCEKQEGYFPED